MLSVWPIILQIKIEIMTKIWNILPLAAVMVAFFACAERNTPIDNTGTETGEQTGETDTIDDKVEEQNWSDTIRVVWNGAAATVTGTNDSLSITNSNGYVAINSSVTGTQIVYLLSGNGQGQLSIYGSYRHNITLDGLTACPWAGHSYELPDAPSPRMAFQVMEFLGSKRSFP